MPHYKDPQNKVHFLESASFEHLLPAGSVEITEDEAAIGAAPSPEQLATNVRVQRNAMLSACDWTQVSDAPIDKSAWAAYRQLLRDVPEQSGFPTTVSWPTSPA